MHVLQYEAHNADLIARGLWAIGAGQKPELRRETVIRASTAQNDPGAAMAFPVLWYRYQLAVWYLELEGWADRDIWEVALGIHDNDQLGAKFASMAQAVADLSIVDATVQQRGPVQLCRGHDSFRVASIGIVDRLAWDCGSRTERGRDIDAYIVGMFRSDDLAAG